MTRNFSIRTNKVTFALVAVAAVDDANNYGDGEDGSDGDENGDGEGDRHCHEDEHGVACSGVTVTVKVLSW